MNKSGKMPKSPGAYNSKLNQYRDEIIARKMRGENAAQIFRWLIAEKKMQITYQNVHKFIKRNSCRMESPNALAIIRQIQQMPESDRKDLFQILSKLFPEDFVPFPKQKSTVKTGAAISKSAEPDFMQIKETDTPAAKRLKKLAALDSSELYDQTKLDEIMKDSAKNKMRLCKKCGKSR